jgi:hypothetical protein
MEASWKKPRKKNGPFGIVMQDGSPGTWYCSDKDNMYDTKKRYFMPNTKHPHAAIAIHGPIGHPPADPQLREEVLSSDRPFEETDCGDKGESCLFAVTVSRRWPFWSCRTRYSEPNIGVHQCNFTGLIRHLSIQVCDG